MTPPGPRTETVYFRLGRLPFSISGDDAILAPVLDELTPIKAARTDESRLSYEFEANFPELGEHVHLPPMMVGRSGFRSRSNLLEHQVMPEPGRTRVFVRSDIKKWLADRVPGVSRFKDWNYLSKEEAQAKNFTYNIYDYTTQVENLEVGQSYVHASTLEKDGKAVLLAAWGGIGKTSSMLKMVMEDGWRFLSDDLSLIDRSGTVYLVPKKLQVYAYNVQGEKTLEQALIERGSRLDRLSWHYHLRKKGVKGVRRRVSAQELLGPERVSKQAELRTVVHLQRWSGDRFEHARMDPGELVDACTHTLLEELRPFPAISTTVRVAGQGTPFPTIPDFCDRTANVLTEAFSDADHVLLKIPSAAGPHELVTELKGILD